MKTFTNEENTIDVPNPAPAPAQHEPEEDDAGIGEEDQDLPYDLPPHGQVLPPEDEISVLRPPGRKSEALLRSRTISNILRRLFIKLRRFRRAVSAEEILPALVSEQQDITLTRHVVETACDVYHRAVEQAGGDRKDACVLSAMELRALDGKRVHPE